MTQFNFEGIGTKWRIDIYTTLSTAEETKLLSKIKKRIDKFDKAYSRFRDDSLVMRMSKDSGTFVLPEDAQPMLSLYSDVYTLTDGLVTPLVGNILSDAGYDKNYSLQQEKELSPALPWKEVMEYKHPHLTIKKPVLLDFGAAGKGYLVDLIAEVLESNNISEYCIDAGGDILYKNKTPMRIGLENPENTNEVIGVYTLGSGSICGSAGNRRVWGDFTHIINPKTLISPRNILAVWVSAKTALLADMLATCLFFVPADKLSKAYHFEYILLYQDHSIAKSEHFSDEIFLV